MAQRIYRVVDAVCDNETQLCLLYCRDAHRQRVVIKLPAMYTVIVGCENPDMDAHTALMHMFKRNLLLNVAVKSLGMCSTYYRGKRNLLQLSCSNYAAYVKVLDTLRYQPGTFYTCNGHSTVEDLSLMAAGIYACLYIAYDEDAGKLSPAPASLHFPYQPVVASFDLEMLSLNAYEPECEVYMAGYTLGHKSYLIYSQRYLSKELEDRDISYIRVESRAAIASQLARLIHETAPDVLTGYNIYNADVPMIYTMLRRELVPWPKSASEPAAWFQYTRKMHKHYADSERGLALKVPGMHCIDMYGYLYDNLPKEEKSGMKLDDVGARYIGEQKHPMGHRELARIYHYGTVSDRVRAMKYCIQDCKLAWKLYDKFNVWNAHSSIYALSGIDHQRNACGGGVMLTYGMCSVYAHRSGMYMDAPDNKVYKPTGGMVFDPIPGEYSNVACVDITSLYPNIVIAHNIDALTVTPNVSEERLRATKLNFHSYYYSTEGVDILYTGDDKPHAFSNNAESKVTSMLPSVLWSLLTMREAVKQAIVAEADVEKKRLLDAKQFALKLLANTVCGTLGERTPGNPMGYCMLNDIITTTGRKILSLAIDVANNMGIRVIYGDTDSLFIDHKGRVDSFLETVHELLPRRIRFKVEYIASKFILGKKKHYVALMPSGRFRVMGYKAVASSRCIASKQMFLWLVDALVKQGEAEMRLIFEEYIAQHVGNKELDATLMSTAFKVTGKRYTPKCYQAKLIAQLTARNVELIPGNSVDLVQVLTQSAYKELHSRKPPIALPDARATKAGRMYTLDEIGAHVDVIDIRGVLGSQCMADVNRLVKARDTLNADSDSDHSDEDSS